MQNIVILVIYKFSIQTNETLFTLRKKNNLTYSDNLMIDIKGTVKFIEQVMEMRFMNVHHYYPN